MATPPHGRSFAGAALALAVTLAACSSSRRSDLDGATDLAVEGGPSDGTQGDAAGTTCQDIRICVALGGSLDTCVKRGTPAAQETFNTLLSCLTNQPTPGCMGTEPQCICPEECYGNGLCLDETGACLDMSGITDDAVCNTLNCAH